MGVGGALARGAAEQQLGQQPETRRHTKKWQACVRFGRQATWPRGPPRFGSAAVRPRLSARCIYRALEALKSVGTGTYRCVALGANRLGLGFGSRGGLLLSTGHHGAAGSHGRGAHCSTENP